MKIFVLCDEVQKSEILSKSTSAEVRLQFYDHWPKHISESFDGWILLLPDVISEIISAKDDRYLRVFGNKPVIVNSAIFTLRELGLPENFIRICGWHSFLQRSLWEAATTSKLADAFFSKLSWDWTKVEDTTGLVAPRVIAMIVNEAYFALQEGVSSKNEINMAMKLGTNYPHGPFEWEEIIGHENIFQLLEALSKRDRRYMPCLLLNKSMNTKT